MSNNYCLQMHINLFLKHKHRCRFLFKIKNHATHIQSKIHKFNVIVYLSYLKNKQNLSSSLLLSSSLQICTQLYFFYPLKRLSCIIMVHKLHYIHFYNSWLVTLVGNTVYWSQFTNSLTPSIASLLQLLLSLTFYTRLLLCQSPCCKPLSPSNQKCPLSWPYTICHLCETLWD